MLAFVCESCYQYPRVLPFREGISLIKNSLDLTYVSYLLMHSFRPYRCAENGFPQIESNVPFAYLHFLPIYT